MKLNLFTLSCCIICLMLSLPIFADEDCDLTLREAKTAYNAGEYAKAKKLYDYVVTYCGPSYGNASSWSQKCQDELKPKLSVSRSSISVGASSGSTSITVTSNRTWKLNNTNSSLFTVSRNGNNVTISYSANPNTSSRSDYFDVVTTDGSKSVRVHVNQAAKVVTTPYLTVDKTSISASSYGKTETITVSSNTTWEIQYPSASMYSVSRSGNTLTVTINENTSTESRSDFFRVKSSDGEIVHKISLSQSGRSSSAPYLRVDKTSISASSYGKTETITVSSNTTWEIQYPSASMYSVSRSGNTLTVTINENTSTESRSDFFRVKTTDGEINHKISLSQTGRSSSSKSAKINKVWVDYDVYEDGYKGMRIHVNMNAYNLKNKRCRATAYFYTESGTALKDKNGRYHTTDGDVSCGEDFTPSYDNSLYEDFKIFMPYSELHVSYKGSFKFFVNLWDHSVSPSGDLAESDWVHFTYTP